MKIIEKESVPPAVGRLHADLRPLEWAKGLSDETLTAITERAEWIEFHAGEIVIEVDSQISHAYFLITGRMHVALYDLQALVDGGLLNNVPADVLAAAGCNFVIASSVTAKLERDFARMRSKGYPHRSLFFSTIQVIMRERMIQGYKMNAVGVQPADFVIAPDVTSFDISEFSRADEMALVGEATADAALAQLRTMLRKLDPRLFASS